MARLDGLGRLRRKGERRCEEGAANQPAERTAAGAVSFEGAVGHADLSVRLTGRPAPLNRMLAAGTAG